jgi:hypothetical protein
MYQRYIVKFPAVNGPPSAHGERRRRDLHFNIEHMFESDPGGAVPQIIDVPVDVELSADGDPRAFIWNRFEHTVIGQPQAIFTRTRWWENPSGIPSRMTLNSGAWTHHAEGKNNTATTCGTSPTDPGFSLSTGGNLPHRSSAHGIQTETRRRNLPRLAGMHRTVVPRRPPNTVTFHTKERL